MKDNNYIVIPGWVINHLGIKGNELLIYCIIYGFSQTDDCCFNGSLKYLIDATQTSKTTVIEVLKKLIEKNLIIKQEEYRSNQKFCSYTVNFETLNKILTPGQETVPGVVKKLNQVDDLGGGKETVPNNTNNSNNYINIIIDYINNKLDKNYKYNNKKYNVLISQRLREGFTVDDFKKVIDNKYLAWADDDKMSRYLRPETLFGSKFETYLNETPKKKGGAGSGKRENKTNDSAYGYRTDWTEEDYEHPFG